MARIRRKRGFGRHCIEQLHDLSNRRGFEAPAGPANTTASHWGALLTSVACFNAIAVGAFPTVLITAVFVSVAVDSAVAGGGQGGANNVGGGTTGGSGGDADQPGTDPNAGGGAGGIAGTSGSPNGGNGAANGLGSGGGGGGYSNTALPNGTFTLSGGNGGIGPNYFSNGSGGAGGGAGGNGAELAGTGPYLVGATSTVRGGAGGNGGNGDSTVAPATGGGGGSGGIGIDFSQTGATLQNAGTITGGNGGTGGTGGAANGANGVGGAGVVGAGLTIVNSGSIAGGLSGDTIPVRADAITFTSGSNFLTLSSGATAGTLTGGISISGSLTIDPGAANGGSATLSNVIQDAANGAGSITLNTARTLTLTGANTYSGGTTISGGGTIVAGNPGVPNGSLGSGAITLNNGTLVNDQGTDLINNVMVAAGGGTFRGSSNYGLDGNISGAGQLTFQNTGAANNNLIILIGDNSAFTGTTIVASGVVRSESLHGLSPNSAYQVASGATLDLGGFSATIGSLSDSGGGGGVVSGDVVVLTTGGNNSSTTFSGVIQDGTGGTLGLIKAGSGTFTLAGTNTYTGATTVNAGVLNVTGSIASSVLTTVNANATLTGTGAVGATQINTGGAFAPGNGTPGSSMTVASLVLASGAQYMVQINPVTSSFATVTGTATLGGASVNATFSNGSYISKQYTILTAGSRGGTFGSLVNTNLPTNFTTSLSYDPTHAFLNLTLNFVPPPGPTGPSFGSGLNINQQAVANTLVNFFNTTGGIPMAFGTLSPSGLSQVSGEAATGSQQTTFNAMGQFMGLMTDPFMVGRGDGPNAGGGANGYADEANAYAGKRKPSDALAAIYTKAPPVQSFEARWSTWIAGYGGSQTTDGNAVLGSNNTTSSVYGTAVGADYRFSRDTIAGFSLAGGGTNFNVVGSGYGRSDLFQAGAFIRHTVGAAYISGALAYGWQDIATDRIVTAAGADHLRAEFNANAFSGRVEGGYRFVSPWIGGVGITPYAAGQFTTFDLPAYAESALSGANTFALAYGAKDVTDTRSELGFRTDKSFAMQNAILTLRSRFAWAHDFNPDRSIGATFQTLPGASFVVNGAAQASDSALTTASAELKWTNDWSVAATFEGEFSSVTNSYAGKGVVRYQW